MKKLDRILLVDNDKITNYINQKLIKSHFNAGQIEIAYNGFQALEIISANIESGDLPDLIFLDLNMPVMDGFSFLESLNEMDEKTRSGLKTVVLTSSTHEQDIERLKEYNVEYITKPLTKEKLSSLRILEEY